MNEAGGGAIVFGPVSDRSECEVLKRRVDSLVYGPGTLRFEECARRGWIAVPAESENHISDEVIDLVSQYCEAEGIDDLVAVETETLVLERLCYRVHPSRKGLLEFNRAMGLMYWVLMPKNGRWLVLCTRDEFFLIAGSAMDVQRLLATPVETALVVFEAYANESGWTSGQHAILDAVVRGTKELLSRAVGKRT